jgi:hypothetical protein
MKLVARLRSVTAASSSSLVLVPASIRLPLLSTTISSRPRLEQYKLIIAGLYLRRLWSGMLDRLRRFGIHNG